jgi:hypothetical protein
MSEFEVVPLPSAPNEPKQWIVTSMGLSPGQRNAQKCQGNKRQDKDHKKDQLQICDWVSGGLQPVFAIDPFLRATAWLRHHGSVTSPISY